MGRQVFVLIRWFSFRFACLLQSQLSIQDCALKTDKDLNTICPVNLNLSEGDRISILN
jgi:hypothetical protein